MSTDGMPHSPKPPTAMVEPLAMSATASAALATTLSTGNLPLHRASAGPSAATLASTVCARSRAVATHRVPTTGAGHMRAVTPPFARTTAGLLCEA